MDCGATFAPVCRTDSKKLILTIDKENDWVILQFDVKTNYLPSHVKEDVYVRQALGYEIMGNVTSLHGLK